MLHVVNRRFWLPFLGLLDGIIANSRATFARAERAGIASERIQMIHAGVTIREIEPEARSRFRSAYGVGHRAMSLSVGRLTRRKGLKHFVTQVLPRIVQKKPTACLYIVGDVPKGAPMAEVKTPQ